MASMSLDDTEHVPSLTDEFEPGMMREQEANGSSSSPSRPQTSSGSNSNSDGDSIQVLCRFRPESKRELEEGPPSNCILFDDDDQTRVTANLGGKHAGFNFDRVFQPHSNQEDVFEAIGMPTVKSVLDGFNTAILSYGQTGSGKTYTMLGPGFDGRGVGNESMGDPGLIPRVMQSLFNQLAALESDTMEYQVRCCYVEIYQENVRDLLNPIPDNGPHLHSGKEKKSLEIQSDPQRGMLLPKATSVPLHSLQDVFAVLRIGAKHRVVAATKANEASSRSHAILVISVQRYHLITQATKISQMFLVDLAGSEKVEKTEVSGVNLTEANLINRGLLSLGQVIQALVQGGQTGKRVYVPYRNSRLTRLLSNCIGGNSRTSLIINCSPHIYNLQETMSTLRFGWAMKKIKNRAVVNVEISMHELKLLYKESQCENERLKLQIKKLQSEMAIMNELQKFDQARAETMHQQQQLQDQPTALSPTRRGAPSKLFLSPASSSPAPSSDSGSSSASSSSSSSFAPSPNYSSASSSSFGSDSPEPQSAPVGTSSSSSSSVPSSASGRRITIKAPVRRVVEESKSNDEDEAQSDEEEEPVDIRTALRAEVAEEKRNMVLQGLAKFSPSANGASDLRSLILHFICPLSKKVMLDPVIAIDGLTYDRRPISTWFLNHSESPVTGQKLSSKVLIPNTVLAAQIKRFYPQAFKRVQQNMTLSTKGMLSVSSSSIVGMDPDFMGCLPLALLGYLFEFLEHKSLCRISGCSKELHAVGRENRLWKLAAIRRGFALEVAMVRELGNNFKAYYKVKHIRTLNAPRNTAHLARRARADANHTGVYLIPSTGPPGASINIAF